MIKRIRVLFIGHLASSGSFTGADKSLALLITHLNRSSFEPLVLYPQDGLITTLLAQAGIPVQIDNLLPFWDFVFLRPGTMQRLQQLWAQSGPTITRLRLLLRQWNPDVIHVNTIINPLGALLGKTLGIPVVWHIRELLPKGLERSQVLSFVHTTADKVLVISQAVQRTFENEGLRGKIDLLYNGFTPAPADSVARGQSFRRKFGIPGEATLVGFLGTLMRIKGAEEFLRMAATVSREWPDTVFVLVGEEDGGSGFRRTLETTASTLGLGEKVIFTGFYHPSEDALAAMDIVTIPSVHEEPFGRVAVEAMMLKKPVVGSAAGGIPEIILDGKSGFLFPPRNVPAFARCVGNLLRNRELSRSMGVVGQQRAQRVFGLYDKVARVEEVYMELMGD